MAFERIERSLSAPGAVFDSTDRVTAVGGFGTTGSVEATYVNTDRWRMTAEAWDDLRSPASMVTVGATKAPTLATCGLGSLRALAFSGSNDDTIFIDQQLPHAWSTGTELHPHVHFHTTGPATVRWEVDYAFANIGSTWSTGHLVVSATSPGGTKHLIAGLATSSGGRIPGTGHKVSAMLKMRLIRNATHADDTYAGLAYFHEYDTHYQVGMAGSTNEVPSP